MMSAAGAATRTMNSIHAKLKKLDVEKIIADAADSGLTEIGLSLSQLSEMFGRITKEDINVPGNQPIPFRAFRADMARLQYECRFQQTSEGWFFIISWQRSINV